MRGATSPRRRLASVGAVVATGDETDSDALLHAADAALYRAKRAGGAGRARALGLAPPDGGQ